METTTVIDELTKVLLENKKLKDTIRFLERELAKAKESETVLRVWQEALGTTQLTHILARLDRAKRQIEDIQVKNTLVPRLNWNAKGR